jgi:hypothetical protein
MSGDGTRKAYTLSWGTELKLGITSDLNDDDRIDMIMEYLEDKASQSCFDASNRKMQTCHCLSSLEDEDVRNAVALYILWFSELGKQTQQLLLMEKIRSAQLVLEKKRYSNQKLFFFPTKQSLWKSQTPLGMS